MRSLSHAGYLLWWRRSRSTTDIPSSTHIKSSSLFELNHNSSIDHQKFPIQSVKSYQTTMAEPQPILHSLSFKPEKAHHFVHIISSFLNPSECESIIASHTNLIPSNVTPETIRSREVFEDEELAERLWTRLQQLPEYTDNDSGAVRIIDKDGEAWVIEGLNPRFRLCLYEKGKCLSLFK